MTFLLSFHPSKSLYKAIPFCSGNCYNISIFTELYCAVYNIIFTRAYAWHMCLACINAFKFDYCANTLNP